MATPHPVVEGLPAEAMTYFVHSFYPVPDDPSWTVLTSEHGQVFTGRGRDAATCSRRNSIRKRAARSG